MEKNVFWNQCSEFYSARMIRNRMRRKHFFRFLKMPKHKNLTKKKCRRNERKRISLDSVFGTGSKFNKELLRERSDRRENVMEGTPK
jgi:hypothetical protein